MKNLLLIIFLFISSCGYKPVYLVSNQNVLEFDKIILQGDENINEILINNLGLKKDLSNKKSLTLNSNYTVTETSKDSKGQIETYRSAIKVELIITESNKVLYTKDFLAEFSYKNESSKYELANYQSQIKDNLIIKLTEEIVLFLNLT